MPRLDDTQRAALATWWNLAQDAVTRNLLSSDLIAAASDLAAQAGRSLAFTENQALATLYGYARRMGNAAGELQSAAPGQTIDANMVAIPPWARDEQTMNTTPVWHVLFRFDFLDAAGQLQSELRTSVFDMTLPETVGELQDDIGADAQSMADKYNVRLQTVTLHSILAV